MNKALETVLNHFRENAHSEADKGKRFEILIKRFLETEPVYKERFSEVWMWQDWPYRGNFADQGIDLVARESATGQYCAIQCKCYRAEHRLSVSDIATFGNCLSMKWETEAGHVPFGSCIIVDTTNKWGEKLTKTIQNYQIPFNRIGLIELSDASIDWESCARSGGSEMRSLERHQARPHQREAIAKVIAHFQFSDRGKLIMACGTGKTFTALRLAEEYCGGEGLILFLVPSIALLSQSLREWLSQAETNMHAIAVCSDAGASRVKESDDLLRENLPMPACTKIESIGEQYAKLAQKGGLTVIFSTYQSIGVINEAQQLGLLPEFKLSICDEAHRTTGVSIILDEAETKRSKKQKSLGEYDESAFVRVHDNKFIQSAKRLYMTATPRIYSEACRKKAKDSNALIASMDDILLYGEEIHRLPFSQAVRENLLSDYKVFVLCVDEAYVKRMFHRELQECNDSAELKLDDAVKLLGCYNGLRKKFKKQAIIADESHDSQWHEDDADKDDFDEDAADEHADDEMREEENESEEKKLSNTENAPSPEKDLIELDPEPMRRAVAFCGRISDSIDICRQMETITREIKREEGDSAMSCEMRHVDGSMGAVLRNEKLDWLKDPEPESGCRILSNVRCLSEGVDVPALDAVMFLAPRRSQVDIVQAVGRVMRRAEGKKYGYIILPISVPEGSKPEDILDKDKNYDVVWDILQALRAHDDRFNAEINQIELNNGTGGRIEIIGVGESDSTGQSKDPNSPEHTPLLTGFDLGEWKNAIFARIVKKCGTRRYWESWARDIAEIAERQQAHIQGLVEQEKNRPAFARFIKGLRNNINPKIEEDEAIEMLAQQAITKPVFDALFEGYDFAQKNPISNAMNEMLELIHEQTNESDMVKLQQFYTSVRERAAGIDNSAGKQKIIVELYDKFFKTAFPRMSDKLGIVYTPVEIVDFIIHCIHGLLKKEFGYEKGIGEKNVRILDPFTGTGTFMVRLIQSKLMSKRMLAYYIACINIEASYHDMMKLEHYESFEGICLADTFLMGSRANFLSDIFSDNAERVKRLCEKELRVIIGNPPYSAGQGNANDNNQNESYPDLDERIKNTYGKF